MAERHDKLLRRFARGFGIDGDVPREPESVKSEETRPGSLLETPHGPVRQVLEQRTTGYPYSPRPIEELLLPATTEHARFLKDTRLAGFNRDEALFLDTETTGLSHGAGTVAFLIGLAWFEGDLFVMEQLLLDDYDQEQAQLATLLERLETRRYLVTYNGKSFDRSVLENRLVIHRFMTSREAHLRLMPHLDLLHVGRRVYRGLLANHRLPTLERELLDYLRIDDISGEMVPQHYFQYMLSGEGKHIEAVLKHNFDDVLSLVHLADHLLAIIDPNKLPEDHAIAGNLGKLFANSGRTTEAVTFLEHALTSPPSEAIALARLLARLYRKEKRPPADHEGLWLPLCALFPDDPTPLIELAKMAERQRDYARALELTEAALSIYPEDEQLWHRRERLVKRPTRHGAPL